ncbi:hypothetical protein PUR29_35185 [Methylobacterium ajmalii]|uniref:Uncharacterized protein n=1 Tax=Methylobacterium ajmalii TaxID=2738439 RepID=A0ABV0A6K3_9HYPH
MITVVPKPLMPGEFTLRWLEHEKQRFPAQGATRAEFERAIEDVKGLMDVLHSLRETLAEVQEENERLKWDIDVMEWVDDRKAEPDINQAWAGIGRALA